MYKVPFFVKLANPGGSFYDSASRLSISGEQIGEVSVLTPVTKHWLQQGGLVACTEEGELLTLTPVAASTQKPAKQTPAESPVAPKAPEQSAQEADKQEPASEGGEETSIEDLLKADIPVKNKGNKK